MHRSGYLEDDPIKLVDSPNVETKLLPAITEEQMRLLSAATETLRDRCIVNLLFDSVLRLSELCAILPDDIDWNTNTLQMKVKGNREARAAFTSGTGRLLRELLAKTDSHSLPTLLGDETQRHTGHADKAVQESGLSLQCTYLQERICV